MAKSGVVIVDGRARKHNGRMLLGDYDVVGSVTGRLPGTTSRPCTWPTCDCAYRMCARVDGPRAAHLQKMDLEREEFEKWAAEVVGLRNFTWGGDSYENAKVQWVWTVWQAGYAKGAEAAY